MSTGPAAPVVLPPPGAAGRKLAAVFTLPDSLALLRAQGFEGVVITPRGPAAPARRDAPFIEQMIKV